MPKKRSKASYSKAAKKGWRTRKGNSGLHKGHYKSPKKLKMKRGSVTRPW